MSNKFLKWCITWYLVINHLIVLFDGKYMLVEVSIFDTSMNVYYISITFSNPFDFRFFFPKILLQVRRKIKLILSNFLLSLDHISFDINVCVMLYEAQLYLCIPDPVINISKAYFVPNFQIIL